ncbi:Protein MAIN-LIKE 2 [Glycine soja]
MKIRGLRWALSRVIGKVLGTQVSGDVDEAPQCRRPTTSAHKQQAVAPVTKNVEHVVHVVDEIHDQPQERVTDDARADAQGFPDGSHDTSVLTEYVHHVTTTAWVEEEHPELTLSSHGRKVQKFERPSPKIEEIVAAIGLSHLISCFLDTGDKGRIFAFVERWHKETSSFHLSIGEVAITLNDVASLLHLAITDVFHTFDTLHVDQVANFTQEAKDETFQCHGAYVRLVWLRDIYRSKCDARQWTIAA